LAESSQAHALADRDDHHEQPFAIFSYGELTLFSIVLRYRLTIYTNTADDHALK